MLINIPIVSANTPREEELLDAIQYLADIINNTGRKSYIDSMTEKLDECGVEYSFSDLLDNGDTF